MSRLSTMIRLGLLAVSALFHSAVDAQNFSTYVSGLPLVSTVNPADNIYILRGGPGGTSARATQATVSGASVLLITSMLTSNLAVQNTTALTSDVINGPAFLPLGTYQTTFTASLADFKTWGLGQWADGAGNLRAPVHIGIGSAPTYTGTGTGQGILGAFNGDFMHSTVLSAEVFITGACTVGCPTSGYMQANPNIIPVYVNFFTQSGWNNFNSSPTGRTNQIIFGADAFLQSPAQGDVTAYFADMFINSNLSTATSILANPGASVIAGAVGSGVDHTVMQVLQVTLSDNGHDDAAVGFNLVMNRANQTGTQNAWWTAYRAQSEGSQPINVGYQIVGPAIVGADYSFATLQGSGLVQAAQTLAGGQRIYLNAIPTDASSLSRFPSGFGVGGEGSAYIDYVYNSGTPANSYVEVVSGGSSRLQVVANGAVIVPSFLTVNAGILSTSYVEIGGTGAMVSTGELAVAKIVATNTAPGAGYLKMEAVAGTGTSCKLIAYAGTSTTPVTILDNIGSSC